MQAVILAGGLGTRLGSLTARIPKPLVPVAGVPYLEHQLRLLARQSILDVVLLTGYLGQAIEDRFGDGGSLGVSIRYSREPSPLGTGGALRLAAPLIADPFLLIYGDSYLPIDYRDVVAALDRSPVAQIPGLTAGAGRESRDGSEPAFSPARKGGVELTDGAGRESRDGSEPAFSPAHKGGVELTAGAGRESRDGSEPAFSPARKGGVELTAGAGREGRDGSEPAFSPARKGGVELTAGAGRESRDGSEPAFSPARKGGVELTAGAGRESRDGSEPAFSPARKGGVELTDGLRPVTGVVVVYDDREGCTSVRNNIAISDDGFVIRYDKDSIDDKSLKFVEAGVLAFRRNVIDLIPEGVVSLEKDLFPQLIAARQLRAWPTVQRFYDIGTPDRLRAIEEYLSV